MTNQSILERRERAVPRGVATATPVFAARAENAEIWDVEGNRYVDFAGGIAVLNVGHRHPRVMAAVAGQLDAYTHTAFQVMAYEPYIELAEKLNAIAPVEGSQDHLLHHRRGSHRERGEDRARRHRPSPASSPLPGVSTAAPCCLRR